MKKKKLKKLVRKFILKYGAGPRGPMGFPGPCGPAGLAAEGHWCTESGGCKASDCDR